MFRVNNNNASKNAGVSDIFLSENGLLCQPHHHFLCRVERANIVSKGCSERFYKIIWRTLLMEQFHSKAAGLQPETF